MKKILVVVLAIVFVLGMSSVALASGWNWDPTGAQIPDEAHTTPAPHAGYSTSTNHCKTCHAVHLAENSTYKLLYDASDSSDACDHCHVGASPHSVRGVYDASPKDSEHDIATGSVTIPDSSGTTSVELVCNTCHSVHGANALAIDGTAKKYILDEDPNQDDTPVASTVDDFCLDCHNENQGNKSHIQTASDDTHAWTASTNCSSCHTVTDYPHSGAGHALLGNGRSGAVVSTQLDNKCVDCHWNAGETSGVGKTF